MEMIKIEIKNRFTGKILFEYSKENNTIKQTVIEAYKKRANLTGANLRGADLRGADLTGAYLTGADLTGADLTGVNLTGADLTGADLTGANLTGVNLTGVNLTGADLTGANLTGANLRVKIKKAGFFSGLYKYLVISYITDSDEKRVKMGCCDRTLKEWENDFWNNEYEFPNDGSDNSLFRVMAFETAKKWFEIVDKQ